MAQAPGRKAVNTSQSGKFGHGTSTAKDKRDATKRSRVEGKSIGSTKQPTYKGKKHLHLGPGGNTAPSIPTKKMGV